MNLKRTGEPLVENYYDGATERLSVVIHFIVVIHARKGMKVMTME